MDDQLSIFKATGDSVSKPIPGSVTRPTSRLFSAPQVATATFLGTPVAGSILFAWNYQVLGKNRAALLSLGLGVIVTALLVLIAILLPAGTLKLLPLLSIVGMRQAVNYFQGQEISDHTYAGGSKGSWLVTIAVGVFGLVGVVIAFFVVAIAHSILVNGTGF